MTPPPGLFDGTPLQRPVTCDRCAKPLAECACPRNRAGRVVLPKDQQVRVRREKRRGRIVTVIAGLDPRANDLRAILKGLQTSLGAGGTVAGSEIELQGDHRDKMVESLRALGYPAKPSGG